MSNKNKDVFQPSSTEEWRRWLNENHTERDFIWVEFHTKASGKDTISWSEAVDHALCFGWIDSKKVKVDEITYHQYFCPRKPTSTWSRVNKEKLEQLSAQGLMQPAGLKVVEVAKKNGSWTLLDDVEDLIVPQVLQKEFDKHEGSQAFYESHSKSMKKQFLSWIALAKREETQLKRAQEIAKCGAEGKRPKHFG